MKALLPVTLLCVSLFSAESVPQPQVPKKEHMLQEAYAEEKALQTLIACIKKSSGDAQLDDCREAHKKAMDAVRQNFQPPQKERPPKK